MALLLTSVDEVMKLFQVRNKVDHYKHNSHSRERVGSATQYFIFNK